jgi:hypothetical protein
MRVPYMAPTNLGGMRRYGGKPHPGVWNDNGSGQGRFTFHYRGKTYRIARLVCEAFHGPAPEGAVCMHLDENAANNKAENLAWGTQKENMNAPKLTKQRWSRVFSRLADRGIENVA